MAAVVRRLVDDRRITVVGVTGSVGKTSIKELIGAVLATRFVVGVTQGNYNTAIGIPLSFFSGPAGMTHFVAEMGMRFSGEILRLTEMAPPEIAVISNIGPSHLETLGSLDAIQAAKGEILRGLKPGGTAVLNFDDPRVRYLGGSLKDVKVLWYGETQGLDATVESSQLAGDHTLIRLKWEGQRYEIRLPWLGTHQAMNAAAAFLVGIRLGIAPERVVQGLEAVASDRSRIRRKRLGTVEIIEDDYNASPVSMQAALAFLAEQPGRRVAVLGDILELGPDEEKLHRQVGIKVAGSADLLVTVGQRAEFIGEEARLRELPTYPAESVDEAYPLLQSLVRPGDVILVKASHMMGLDRLVARMEEWGGPQ
jgi:UDP-N-acetylmuramoyl-tripeptide--D-alanyl-D-alanine ligase